MLAEQVEHLMTCAEQPHIQFCFVPLSTGTHSGLPGASILADPDILQEATNLCRSWTCGTSDFTPNRTFPGTTSPRSTKPST
ncbi:Scr1 family TA system antitoxin-like transcriptional regulator [Micromonospora sp. RP3T]|uniref:Scr1 family TA system antitoxin-like transcriptional regulator n=1 Tax=Micromonospora sp. RP3T TaxID=2135446 RepID=UPI003D7387CF